MLVSQSALQTEHVFSKQPGMSFQAEYPPPSPDESPSSPPLPHPLAERRCRSLSSSLVVPLDSAPVPLWPSNPGQTSPISAGVRESSSTGGTTYRLGSPLARLLSKSTHDLDRRLVILGGLHGTKATSRPMPTPRDAFAEQSPSDSVKMFGDPTVDGRPDRDLQQESLDTFSQRIRRLEETKQPSASNEYYPSRSYSHPDNLPTVDLTQSQAFPFHVVSSRLDQPLAKSLSRATHDLSSSSSPDRAPSSPALLSSTTTEWRTFSESKSSPAVGEHRAPRSHHRSPLSSSSSGKPPQTEDYSVQLPSAVRQRPRSGSLQSGQFSRSYRYSDGSSGSDSAEYQKASSNSPFLQNSYRQRRNTFSGCTSVSFDQGIHGHSGKPALLNRRRTAGSCSGSDSSSDDIKDLVRGPVPQLSPMPPRSSSDSITEGEAQVKRKRLQRIKSAPVLRRTKRDGF